MNLVALPASLTAAAVVLAALISSLLSAFSVLVASVPGLRLSDASRTSLMRLLVGALNLAGLVGYAWISNVVIAKEMIPALLLTAAGFGVVGGHLVYTGVQAAQALNPVASTVTLAGTNDTILPFSAPTLATGTTVASTPTPPTGSFTTATPPSASS